MAPGQVQVSPQVEDVPPPGGSNTAMTADEDKPVRQGFMAGLRAHYSRYKETYFCLEGLIVISSVTLVGLLFFYKMGTFDIFFENKNEHYYTPS